MTGFNKLQRVRTVVTDRHRMSIRQGENWGELYDLQSDPTEVNYLFDEASAVQIRATLTETMSRQMNELEGWAPSQQFIGLWGFIIPHIGWLC